jgi:putative nucleotidyltransferase with HDIG domain
MISEIDFDAVNGLVQAMVTFDPLAAQHLTATASLAERLSREMGLDEANVQNCRAGALLHDIGQFGMDKLVLNYPGMLAGAEWDMVMEHPLLGERLLLRIPQISHLAPIVRSHHERIDGTGYPDALVGHEIPIESRIITVVDAFHIMTMPQPYRTTFSVSTAVGELMGNSDSQFDRDAVDALIAMLGHQKRHLRHA